MHPRHLPRHRGPLGFGPVGHFVRSRLHRRLFAWFSLSIVLTVAVVLGTTSALGRLEGSPWQRQLLRLDRLVSHQFAPVWEDPARRDELARTFADDLELGVRLRDLAGTELTRRGPDCVHAPFAFAVRDARGPLGTVEVCWPTRHGGPVSLFLPLLLALAVVWLVSGRIAMRLARPLGELSRVVQDIGGGNLKARAELSCRQADEVGVVAEAVNDMAGRLEKQLSDQRELLAAVSHELRTPLARIRLLTEMARSSGATAHTLDELDREVQEIDALVGELLANSRLDFGQLTRSRLAPAEVAGRALERAGLAAGLCAVETAIGAFEADPTLLARALANLLENARRHGGGAVRLVVFEREGQLAFAVEDQGPGFPEGGAPFSAPSSRGDGLGLGLPLVHRIAKAHGGSAFAENRAGGGARVGFSVALGAPTPAQGPG